ncbi:MAG: glycosyl hydrolase family 28-related protein [Gemmataceae bacterium]
MHASNLNHWSAPVLLLVGLLLAGSMASAAGVFNVRDHGAKGDGKSLDTAAINKAVEACAAGGGGKVVLPPGKYLSGTVRLKTDVILYLDAGATLVGSSDLTHYQHFTPPAGTPEARFRSTWHRALILADGAERIGLAGPGVIDGNKVFDAHGEERMRGPHTVLLGNCRDVTIRDLTIRDSANYAFLFEGCDDVEVRNVRVTGGWDGVHFRGWKGRPCRRVSILGCQFYTGDDAIAGRYWDDTLISNCILNSSCNGVRLIGPASRLTIHGCLFYGPGRYEHRSSHRSNMLAAINLQPGGWDPTEGALDDVLIADVTARHVTTPLHVAVKRGNTAGHITVTRLSASRVNQAACSFESWAETAIERVSLRDVSIEYEGKPPAKLPAAIREPGAEARPLPAWGLYARRVNHLDLDNVRLRHADDESRTVLLADGVKRLTLRDVPLPRALSTADAVVLTNVDEVRLVDSPTASARLRILRLDVKPDETTTRFVAGKPFIAKATVSGEAPAGLGKVEVTLGEQVRAVWVWVRPGEKKTVEVRGLVAPAAGTHEVRAGDVRQSITVEKE